MDLLANPGPNGLNSLIVPVLQQRRHSDAAFARHFQAAASIIPPPSLAADADALPPGRPPFPPLSVLLQSGVGFSSTFCWGWPQDGLAIGATEAPASVSLPSGPGLACRHHKPSGDLTSGNAGRKRRSVNEARFRASLWSACAASPRDAARRCASGDSPPGSCGLCRPMRSQFRGP